MSKWAGPCQGLGADRDGELCAEYNGVIDTEYAVEYIDGLLQDCSNSSALATELLQSCTKPSIYTVMLFLFLLCYD